MSNTNSEKSILTISLDFKDVKKEALVLVATILNKLITPDFDNDVREQYLKNFRKRLSPSLQNNFKSFTEFSRSRFKNNSTSGIIGFDENKTKMLITLNKVGNENLDETSKKILDWMLPVINDILQVKNAEGTLVSVDTTIIKEKPPKKLKR